MAPKFFLLAAACAAAAAAGDDKKKDLDKLQGTWDLKSMEVRGKDVKGPATEKVMLVFDKDTMMLKGPSRLTRGSHRWTGRDLPLPDISPNTATTVAGTGESTLYWLWQVLYQNSEACSNSKCNCNHNPGWVVA